VLAESRFYEIEVAGERVSLEEELTKIEEQVSPILARLVRDRRLADISAEDRQIVANFCAVQLIRTHAFRDQIKDMNEGMSEALRRRGIDPSGVPISRYCPRNRSKPCRSKCWRKRRKRLHHISGRNTGIFLQAKLMTHFSLGDHPVVLDNDFGPVGRGVGLASPGVTVYLPLCPTLCLAMTDPRVVSTILSRAREADAGFQELRKVRRRLDRR